MKSSEMCRVRVRMEGILQGVGLRPAIKRLADEAGLRGSVQNRSGAVRLVLEGEGSRVRAFVASLPAKLPPRARLERLEVDESAPLSEASAEGFAILESEADPRARASIPADLASCAACLAEVYDPASRFFGYPFTTCTDCGPRYTVVESMPYDRERTSLARFPLCADCRRDYTDASARRFHAESIACPACGPRLAWHDAEGRPLEVGDPLAEARRLLAAGGIVAIRGLGGFLLAARADAPQTLRALRERKHRPHKPFALMAREPAVAARTVELSEASLALMSAPEAPIVVAPATAAARAGLPLDLLAPDTGELGVMLPTTPLHALLFTSADAARGRVEPAFDLLVMTSGNRGGEPICIANEEAFERLSGIADAFLVHDRPILLRNDDSLVVESGGAPQVWRRARGYAPRALPLSGALAGALRRRVLAMGAELKNAVALADERELVLSPHVGDLETPEAVDGLETVVERLPRFLAREPEAIAVDLHPDMHATRLGRRLAAERGLPLVEVQHHHAHAASALLEHGRERALALVFDGTGLGPDGAIWGAELLDARVPDYERLATFAPVPLPGADAAVREPLRQLAARALEAGRAVDPRRFEQLGASGEELALWTMQASRGLNAPPTHAAGRVFDAFSAGLGLVPRAISHEGQAAMRLEAAARRALEAGARESHRDEASAAAAAPRLTFATRVEQDLLLVDWGPLFARLLDEQPGPAEHEDWALAFHEAMAEAALAMALYGRERAGALPIALSGGVFMNRLLVTLLLPMLQEHGFEVLVHREIPPNDGGIAAGQALVAGGSS